MTNPYDYPWLAVALLLALLCGIAVAAVMLIATEIFGFSVTATVVVMCGALVVFGVLEHIFVANGAISPVVVPLRPQAQPFTFRV